MLLENERADRFGKARSGGYVIWSREQGDILRKLTDEPKTYEERVSDATAEEIEKKFNAC